MRVFTWCSGAHWSILVTLKSRINMLSKNGNYCIHLAESIHNTILTNFIRKKTVTSTLNVLVCINMRIIYLQWIECLADETDQ